MTDMHTAGGVTYRKVDQEYFEKRGLRRYAKVWSLWALGVGAVISGHYSGWNLGLANGFGSMLIALVVIAAMYWGLIFSLAEMSPAFCQKRVGLGGRDLRGVKFFVNVRKLLHLNEDAEKIFSKRNIPKK